MPGMCLPLLTIFSSSWLDLVSSGVLSTLLFAEIQNTL